MVHGDRVDIVWTNEGMMDGLVEELRRMATCESLEGIWALKIKAGADRIEALELASRESMLDKGLAADRIEALETVIRRINSMNDHPAWFRSELDQLIESVGLSHDIAANEGKQWNC